MSNGINHDYLIVEWLMDIFNSCILALKLLHEQTINFLVVAYVAQESNTTIQKGTIFMILYILRTSSNIMIHFTYCYFPTPIRIYKIVVVVIIITIVPTSKFQVLKLH